MSENTLFTDLQTTLFDVIDAEVKQFCKNGGHPVVGERANIAEIFWTIIGNSDTVGVEIVGDYYVFKVEGETNRAFRVNMKNKIHEQDTETLTKIINIITKKI